jgi:spermidine synthase
MNRRTLPLLVFVGGMCSLATEMAGARLLAPYFGTSNLVWANLIGMVLLYLSVGYWLGGKVADRHPNARSLGWVVLVAAVSIAVLPFLSRPLFSAAASAFDELSAGAYIASFFGTLLMFALPITALGAVSPWAIRLAVRDVSEAGTVAGRLYALSTMGSLVGTFLPVLLLIPAVGTQRTLIGTAAVLAVAALPVLPRPAAIAPVALAAMLLVSPGTVKDATDGRVVFEGESAYQFVQVVKQPDGDTVLHLNEGWAIHSILPAAGSLTNGYWDGFLALPLLHKRPAGRLAVLGNAGGTVGNLFAAVWPDTTIDGVEIDPLVSDVGRRYLGMRNPKLTVHTADARSWLRASDGGYDAIIVDAYRQPYIPFHLVSREFFTIVRDRLAADGVVGINVGTPPGQLEAVESIAATMRAVFPSVQQVRIDEFNSIVFGFRTSTTLAASRSALQAATGLLTEPARSITQGLTDVAPGGDVLTDDHSPIEWVTDRALLTYLNEGAPGAAR